MVTTEALQSHWPGVKDQLRQRWNQLNEEDLDRWEGDVERLVRTIRKKTGQAREEIECFLTELSNGSGSASHRAAEAARQYAQRITAKAQDVALDAKESARAGVVHAEKAVRQRPLEAAAFTFGVGLVAGLVLGLTLRSK
jgi:ElaB/YqjD/DUF883 family membrane-anchored ribosome-binding protein